MLFRYHQLLRPCINVCLIISVWLWLRPFLILSTPSTSTQNKPTPLNFIAPVPSFYPHKTNSHRNLQVRLRLQFALQPILWQWLPLFNGHRCCALHSVYIGGRLKLVCSGFPGGAGGGFTSKGSDYPGAGAASSYYNTYASFYSQTGAPYR